MRIGNVNISNLNFLSYQENEREETLTTQVLPKIKYVIDTN